MPMFRKKRNSVSKKEKDGLSSPTSGENSASSSPSSSHNSPSIHSYSTLPKSFNSSNPQFLVQSLLRACEEGKLEEVINYIEVHKVQVNSVDSAGKTPLHYCCINGHLNVAEYLVKNGADYNFQDKTDWTPLHSAACSGNENLIYFLLNLEEMDAGIQNEDNNTPLHYIAKNPCAKNELLPSIVATFVEKGVDLNSFNINGETALHNACLKNYIKLLELLIQFKADVNLRNDHGETPLHWAARMGHEKCVACLIDAGADPLLEGMDGTPLQVSAPLPTIQQILKSASKQEMNYSTPTSSTSTSPRDSPRVSDREKDTRDRDRLSSPRIKQSPSLPRYSGMGLPLTLTTSASSTGSVSSVVNQTSPRRSDFNNGGTNSLTSSRSSDITPRSHNLAYNTNDRESSSYISNTPVNNHPSNTNTNTNTISRSPSGTGSLSVNLAKDQISPRSPRSTSNPIDVKIASQRTTSHPKYSPPNVTFSPETFISKKGSGSPSSSPESPMVVNPYNLPYSANNSNMIPTQQTQINNNFHIHNYRHSLYNPTNTTNTNTNNSILTTKDNLNQIHKPVPNSSQKARHTTYNNEAIKSLAYNNSIINNNEQYFPPKYGSGVGPSRDLNGSSTQDMIYELVFFNDQSFQLVLNDANWESILQDGANRLNMYSDVHTSPQFVMEKFSLSNVISKYLNDIGDSKISLVQWMEKFLNGGKRNFLHFLFENYSYQILMKNKQEVNSSITTNPNLNSNPNTTNTNTNTTTLNTSASTSTSSNAQGLGDLSSLNKLYSSLVFQERIQEAIQCKKLIELEMEKNRLDELYQHLKHEDKLQEAIQVGKAIEDIKSNYPTKETIDKWRSAPDDSHLTIREITEILSEDIDQSQFQIFMEKFGKVSIPSLAFLDLEKALDTQKRAVQLMEHLLTSAQEQVDSKENPSTEKPKQEIEKEAEKDTKTDQIKEKEEVEGEGEGEREGEDEDSLEYDYVFSEEEITNPNPNVNNNINNSANANTTDDAVIDSHSGNGYQSLTNLSKVSMLMESSKDNINECSDDNIDVVGVEDDVAVNGISNNVSSLSISPVELREPKRAVALKDRKKNGYRSSKSMNDLFTSILQAEEEENVDDSNQSSRKLLQKHSSSVNTSNSDFMKDFEQFLVSSSNYPNAHHSTEVSQKELEETLEDLYKKFGSG